jgi:hypothetical protein
MATEIDTRLPYVPAFPVTGFPASDTRMANLRNASSAAIAQAQDVLAKKAAIDRDPANLTFAGGALPPNLSAAARLEKTRAVTAAVMAMRGGLIQQVINAGSKEADSLQASLESKVIGKIDPTRAGLIVSHIERPRLPPAPNPTTVRYSKPE